MYDLYALKQEPILRLSGLDVQWFYSASYGCCIFQCYSSVLSALMKFCLHLVSQFQQLIILIVTLDFVLGNLNYLRGHYKHAGPFCK